MEIKRLVRYLGVCFLFFFSYHVHAMTEESPISNYKRVFIPVWNPKEKSVNIAIRYYERGSHPFFLVVRPDSLEVSSVSADQLQYRKPARLEDAPTSIYFHQSELQPTLYIQLLDRIASPPFPLQNGGITKALHPKSAHFLTVDMCPSSRPFEKAFFEQLIALSKASHRAIPLAICVSGLWILSHKEEFRWLRDQHQAGALSITWVNHSWSHPYAPDVPLERNFLLSPGISLENEVFQTERILLQNQIVPSVFFRFPGLVSDQRLMHQIKELGLIPLGSDSWIAKGQGVHPGSFLLVHGNGNEPDGIKKILPMLPPLNLRPLREAFDLSL